MGFIRHVVTKVGIQTGEVMVIIGRQAQHPEKG
jgi:hypothetical protein